MSTGRNTEYSAFACLCVEKLSISNMPILQMPTRLETLLLPRPRTTTTSDVLFAQWTLQGISVLGHGFQNTTFRDRNFQCLRGGSEMAVVAAGVGGSCLLSPHLTNLTAGTLCMQHPSLMFASSKGLNKLNNALDRESQKCVEFCGPLPSCMHPIERGPRPRWRMRPF